MSTPPPKSCGRCNKTVGPDARFCHYCGTPLDDAVTLLLNRPASVTDPLIGKVIGKKYKIVESIPGGGMGKVYKALRMDLDDIVVIKVLGGGFLPHERAPERFRREARAAAKIQHRNVVSIYDFGEIPGSDVLAYIVMELVPGVSLKDLLNTAGPLSLERTISLMKEICAGVKAGHAKGVIHRDLKPGNIIVFETEEKFETAKVVDFGLAKIRDDVEDTSLTQPGRMIGTLAYMSPEQCRGEVLSNASDVYSLGIITYEMLVGHVPFRDKTTCHQHQNELPSKFPAHLGIPAEVESVIMKALAKDPNDRAPDALVYSTKLLTALQKSGGSIFNGNFDPTLEDQPAPPEPGPCLLNQKELQLLNCSFEVAFKQQHNDLIQVDYVLDQAGQKGLSTNDGKAALNSLLEKRVIKVRTPNGYRHFLLTGLAFEEYANVFINGYSSIKDHVVALILEGTCHNNFAIAERLNQTNALINQILTALSEKELIVVARRLGGKIAIKTVSPDLQGFAV
jgi:eukaryotic-like serine/threonine-protein kinase